MTSRKPPNGPDLFPDSPVQYRPTIHRSRHRGNFTILSNEGVNDRRLSLDTKGLLWWLLTKPNDWLIIWSHLAKVHSISRWHEKRISGELQAAGYLQQKQAQSQKGRFAQVQYDLFEAPSEDRDDESHESHDDQSQPWITAGISRATWFRRKTGNPSATETRTASPKQPRGETQYTASISGNGEAGKPCATASIHASRKTANGETR